MVSDMGNSKLILLKEDPPHWAGPVCPLITRPLLQLAMWLQVILRVLKLTLYMFFTVVCEDRDRIRASWECLVSTLSTTELHSQPCVLLKCHKVIQILSVLCSLQNSRRDRMFKQYSKKESGAQGVTRDSITPKCSVCISEGVLLKHTTLERIIIDTSNIIPTNMTYIFYFAFEPAKVTYLNIY